MRNKNLGGDIVNLFVAGHVTEVYGPVQALITYLKNKKKDFKFILHPLPYSNIRFSKYGRSNTAFTILKKMRNFKIELLVYIQHVIFNLVILLDQRHKIDIYIGIDNLNAFSGIIFRWIGKVDKVVYYVIDYTPKRFENPVLNYLYHMMDEFCVKHSDYVWNISERIAKIREKQGVPKEKNIVVPVGIELDKIKIPPIESIRRNVIVFVSHLERSKGIQLAIEAMKIVVRKHPDAVLEIIGTGPYEDELKELVRKRGLEENVKFLGVMEHDALLQYLPTCGIALATYLDDPDSITYYADPTKPKEYLACGLPVIITKVPWIAEEIERRRMGIAINYNKEELVRAINKLLTDDNFYKMCRKNAIEFTKNLSWDKIFDEAFSKVIQ
jgi:glycosyltransferase involved in cell wall biosynthesis